MNDTLVLTPSALLAFLSQVEELLDKDIELFENEDSLEIRIGDATYNIESSASASIEVEEDVVEELDEINEDGYEEIDADDFTEVKEIEGDLVEGGIIKELVKTLAVGGLVRLTTNMLKK